MSELRFLRVIRLGKSYVVAIPKEAARKLGICKGDYVVAEFDEKRGVLVYRKIHIEERRGDGDGTLVVEPAEAD